MLYAERAQRVADRVHDRWQRTDGPSLTGTLDAERIALRRYFVALDLEERELVGARHAVIHERAAQALSAIGIVDHVLEQRLADPLHDAAMELALDDQR